jgi:hypothetical protein
MQLQETHAEKQGSEWDFKAKLLQRQSNVAKKYYLDPVVHSLMVADSPHVCLRDQEFRASITVESVSEDSS